MPDREINRETDSEQKNNKNNISKQNMAVYIKRRAYERVII